VGVHKYCSSRSLIFLRSHTTKQVTAAASGCLPVLLAREKLRRLDKKRGNTRMTNSSPDRLEKTSDYN